MALFQLKKWRCRKYCVLVSALMLDVSLKTRLNLCSRRWLKPNLSLVKVLLTFQTFCFFFSLDFKCIDFIEKLHLITFWSRINERKNTFLICSNQEYYWCYFRNNCFWICPSNFIETTKFILVTGTGCMCTNNYWKYVNNKCLRELMLLYFGMYCRIF